MYSRHLLRLVGLTVFPIILLSACTVARGSGDFITESRNVSKFDSVCLSGSGDVTVWATDSLDVSVSGSGSV